MKRLDDVLGYKNMKIYQDSQFFSFSLDSIILGNYSTVRYRDKMIVDFCTGNGIIPLILSRRTNKPIIGVEIQSKLCDLANETILYNHLENQITIECKDIKDYSLHHLDEFDLVLCNPPYFKVEDVNFFHNSYEKRVARHEIYLNLNELCTCAKKVLKEHGTFCLVHRSDRLIEIIEEFRKANIEPKRIKFIYENIHTMSNLVLIEGQKSGNIGLKIDKPLILYNLDGSITEEYLKLQEEVIL